MKRDANEDEDKEGSEMATFETRKRLGTTGSPSDQSRAPRRRPRRPESGTSRAIPVTNQGPRERLESTNPIASADSPMHTKATTQGSRGTWSNEINRAQAGKKRTARDNEHEQAHEALTHEEPAQTQRPKAATHGPSTNRRESENQARATHQNQQPRRSRRRQKTGQPDARKPTQAGTQESCTNSYKPTLS